MYWERNRWVKNNPPVLKGLTVLPINSIQEISFSAMLNDVGIYDIEKYCETMNEIGTKVKTYLTKDAIEYFKNDPYKKYVLKINEKLVKTPQLQTVVKLDDDELWLMKILLLINVA
ncbi:unnamed protein product [Didymodactylos carnosus]|uniref:Uncharacterized protein n=1 Tax=Didymodactylos carnosus TaxID=1234261 RepID=A0A815TH12_9BILA|nr:unnamed protein product [Didymodactylos carnosus]CAF4367146.1 unnamed protein product [Didymodactylos carnosus]